MNQQVTQQEATVASEVKPDKVTKTQTLYDVSAWQIIWRNFLAGAFRALGGLTLYLVLVVIVGNIFLTYVYPHLKPLIDDYQTAIRSFNRISNPQSAPPNGTNNSLNISDQQLQEIINSPQFKQMIQTNP